MKKKISAILIAGLIVAVVFSTISASATVINKEQEENTFLPGNMGETGGIGAFVFQIKPSEASTIPLIKEIRDATVICTDINGETHNMEYVEFEPDFYAYIAYDVPVGNCDITASKDGYKSSTISAEVNPEDIQIYKIELKENLKSRTILFRLFNRLPNAFPILKLLLRL